MSDCDNDCIPPAAFPKPVSNRPGLPTIGYRIGTYADLRARMLLAIDEAPTLKDWTHRLPDDPGIALLEAAAEVGDILSFYQDLYANEAYLRTAKWRDSIAALVRLTGYRLAPGLGGRARFAIAVKGERPVALPAGLGLKAQLDGDPAPSVFETTKPLLAHPALSQFHLYRPRLLPDIRHGTTRFTLAPGSSASLKPGDRVMVGLLRSASGGAAYDHAQILVVDQVEASFGSTVITMKGGITTLVAPKLKLSPGLLGALSPPSGLGLSGGLLQALSGFSSLQFLPLSGLQQLVSVGGGLSLANFPRLPASLAEASVAATPSLRAWKLGATHRHFGHNAPPTRLKVDSHGLAKQIAISYLRNLDSGTGGDGKPALGARELPLDGEVKTLIAGTRVLIEGELSKSLVLGQAPRLLSREIAQVERRSLAWGDLSGASTVATLDTALATTEHGTSLDLADIRNLSIHEVVGDGFDLHADFANGTEPRGKVLHWYGSKAAATALDQRSLLFADAGGAVTPVTVLKAEADSVGPNQPDFHRLHLDQEVDYARFPYRAPPVTVYGNLVEATQGKTEAQITLGDGDARATFQSFAIPKTPLTYLLDTTQVPPQLAQLQVWVDGIAWTRVDSLYGRGASERVYIVREDDDGKSWVQFGDGQTGARLKTGRGNVVAIYRSGNGADGALKPDAKPSLDKKLPGLDAAFLLEPVTGGAPAESADGARRAAPGRMQSLGRIVSLADYEAEALALPGATKARAAWATLDGVPVVRVAILTESRASADANAAAEALRAAVRSRGAGRCPLRVVIGTRTAITASLVVGIDAARRAEDIRPAILEALGVDHREGGLFSEGQRQFGETAHGSQVVAAVQNVPGVIWVRLTQLGPAIDLLPIFRLLGAPSLSRLVYRPPTQRALACPGDSLLTLAAGDLALQLSATTGAAP